MDAAFQRHQDEMQHSLRLWTVRQSGAWRSADGRPSSSSLVGIGGARHQVYASRPETPKLEPPPISLTPVHNLEPLRKVAMERDKLTVSEVGAADEVVSGSESSTRCGSFSGMDASQTISEDPTPDKDHTVIGVPLDVTPDPLPFPPRRPTAAWQCEEDHDPPLLNVSFTRGFTREGFNSTPAAMSKASTARSSSTLHGGKKRYKNGALFSPLSKRKLEVLEVNQSPFERITRSRMYESFNALMIALNAIFILWETESRARLAASGKPVSDFQDNDLWFTLAATVFVVIFMVDIILRVLAEGCRLFMSGRERFWNVFDVFVTFTAAFEVMLQWVLYASASESSSSLRMHLRKFSMLRIVRLLRVIETTRAMRMVRVFRELRLMVMSLVYTFKPLAWSVILVLIFLLIFGVFFTDGAVAYCVEHQAMDKEETRLLRQYFGTLFTSALSLYMAMTGGEDWANIFRALDLLPMEYRQLFVVFVTFAILALLNVVTAVFVGTAMQRSQHDTELMIQQELEHKDEFVATLQQVFDELDANNSGSLSLEEFEQYINDEKIMAYLRTLDINISHARMLFTLLDVDLTGEVDIDEFASGLLRLKGGASSIDMAVLKYQIEWIHHNVMQLQKLVAGSLDAPPSDAAAK